MLIVDDDPDNLLVIESSLRKRFDYPIRAVHSVDEAERLLKKENFHIVISDFEMPERKGSELIHTLQNHSNPMPLIFYTASDQPESFWDSLGYPCRVIKKPNIHELLQVVKALLPSASS